MTPEEKQQLERQLLFTPCKTKEELGDWIDHMLGYRLPDCIVDVDSNSSPLDLVWEIYHEALYVNSPNFEKILAYANRFGAKCCEKGTLLLTKDSGLKKIEDIRVGEVIWSGWDWRKVTDWIHDGVKPGVKMILSNGASLTGSMIHRVWSWRNGEVSPGWTEISKLLPGDLVKWDTNSHYKNSPINKEDFDLGYACGLISGDGCVTQIENGDYPIYFSNTDQYVLDFWKNFCIRYAGKEPKQSKSRPCDWILHSKRMVVFLKTLGIERAYSYEKRVPSYCFSNRSAMVGFISGLFDTDGSITEKGMVKFDLTAKTLLRDLQIMLASLGVASSYHKRPRAKASKHDCYSVLINGNSVKDLLNAGVEFRARKARPLKETKNANQHDGIPKSCLSELLSKLPLNGGRWRSGSAHKPQIGQYKKISRAKLKKLLSYGVDRGTLSEIEASKWQGAISSPWVPVKTIEKRDLVDFYDLTVEKDHSYWSNGVVSHNTLGASALELLMVFHDQRDVVHLAAIEEQSTDCLNYVKKALRNPVMAPFEVQGDKRAITIQVFKKDGKYYSPKEYEKIPDVEKFGFQEHYNKIEVIVATPKSLNGKHGAFFCIDENTPLLIADKTRSRKSRSAKFVFNSIAGLPVTGRRGRLPTEDLDVSNPQKDIELLTFNFSTGSLEPKKILRGHRKRAQAISIGAGKRTLVCTQDHPIFVFGKGFIEAGSVSLGDKIFAVGKGGWGNRCFKSKEAQIQQPVVQDSGDTFEQIVLGSLLGDGSCLKHTRSKNAYFSERHCIEQAEYLNWKRQIIGQQVKTSECKGIVSGYTGSSQVGFYTQNSHVFNQWLGFKQHFQNLEKIGPLGLSVWYMDDGYAKGFSIASHGFTKNQNERLVELLWKKFQIKTRVAREVKKDGRSYWYITGGLEAKRRLVEICRPHIHPQMAFKFNVENHSKPCVVCGQKFWPHLQGPSSKTCGQAVCLSVLAGTFEAVVVDKIEPAGERTVYDFTVEENHNFFSGQILSHNCMDETDLLDNESIIQEADGVPTPTKDRRAKHPIVYMTSTRKKAAGRVQKLIDRAEQEDIRVRHWNLIDITKPCPPEKHQPNEPKVSMYVDDNALKAIPEESYEQLNEGDRLKYQKHEMFQGCKSCPLAATCKSRLATHQKSSNSTLLLDHAFTTKKVTKGNIEFIKSQFLCFAPGTQILTGMGIFKNIEHVRVGDLVVTHLGNVRKVTQIMSRPYSGNLIEIGHPSWMGFGSTLVTGEHPYYVNGEKFLEASEMKSSTTNKQRRDLGDYLSLPSSYVPSVDTELDCTEYVESSEMDGNRWVLSPLSKTRQGVSLPKKIQLTYDFGWFLGYFLAEGHVSYRVRGNGGNMPVSVTFTCHSEEKHLHKKVLAFASSLGLSVAQFKSKESKFGYALVINNRSFAGLMEALCGRWCDKKKINSRLMNYNIEFLKGILDGFWDGDGNKRPEPQKTVTTTSYSLSGQLFLIAARLGLCPRIKKKPLNPGQKKQPYLVIYQNPDYRYIQNRTKFKTNENNNLYRLDHKSIVQYSGIVYNFEVEGDSSYIANGIAVHNCRKPLSTGSVFSRFSREKHLLSAAEIYEKLEQQQAPANFNKQSLVKYLKAHPLAKFYGGIDFGYTHMFVAIVAAKVGLHWFILDCLMATELETMECVDLCKRSFYHYGAEWYPDPENPQLISTFKKHGFNCIDFSKKKGTVLAGIEAIRAKLNPGPDAEPQMFFLKGDPSIDGEEESLVEAMEKWSWKLSPTGEPTDIPAEKHKDQVDALRYMVYNITPVRSTNGNRGGRPTNEEVASRPKTLSEQFWDTMKSEGEPLFGLDLSERPDPYDTDPSSAKTTPKIRKRFF